MGIEAEHPPSTAAAQAPARERCSKASAPIRASPDGRFLVDEDGEPFFWLGDTGWAIFARLTRAETDDYFRDRAAKGFNLIQAVAIGGPFDGLDVPNRQGDLALIDMDLARPNPRYFEHIDWVVTRAGQYGLRIAMLPVWGARLIGGLSSKGPVFDSVSARRYGRWIGARYRDQGVIWVLGGDTNPLWPKDLNFLGVAEDRESAAKDMTIVDYRPVYDAMAAGIIEGEGGKPFLTYHPCPLGFPGAEPPRTSVFLRDRGWLAMNMLQTSHFANAASDVFPSVHASCNLIGPLGYRYVEEEYRSTPTRPVLDGEPRYEGIPVDIKFDPRKGLWDAYDARNAAYQAVFAGACGHTYGSLSVHLSHDPALHPPIAIYPGILKHWRDDLDAPGATQMMHLKNLMLSRPYFTRIPDQDLVIGEAGEGEAHVAATRDRRGQYAMIFSPKGETVVIDLARMEGPRLVAWWFNPRTGRAVRNAESFAANGVGAFQPPTRGADQDWVLVLDCESAGFACPGRVSVEQVPPGIPRR
jgi:hypothetical protein